MLRFNPELRNLQMQRHLKVKQRFTGKGPFGTKAKRDDAQMPGDTGPKTKARAKKMRKPPFSHG